MNLGSLQENSGSWEKNILNKVTWAQKDKHYMVSTSHVYTYLGVSVYRCVCVTLQSFPEFFLMILWDT